MTVWQLMFWNFLLSNSTEECVKVGKKDVLYSLNLILWIVDVENNYFYDGDLVNWFKYLFKSSQKWLYGN